MKPVQMSLMFGYQYRERKNWRLSFRLQIQIPGFPVLVSVTHTDPGLEELFSDTITEKVSCTFLELII